MFKVHICPIKGDHDVGLACLSDGQVLQILFNLWSWPPILVLKKSILRRGLFYDQVLPILLNLDPDDLLNCGRASPRLYRLVSDWEVWTHLLKRVTRFSNERVDQLINFREESSRFGIVPRPRMFLEMVKEVALRCQEEALAEKNIDRGLRFSLNCFFSKRSMFK